MAYFTQCMITHRILLWLNSFESFLQRNSDLHWLQCNQSSVYWDSPSHLTWMCAHIHPCLCVRKLIFSWSCGWLQENKQALILLKHDLHQTMFFTLIFTNCKVYLSLFSLVLCPFLPLSLKPVICTSYTECQVQVKRHPYPKDRVWGVMQDSLIFQITHFDFVVRGNIIQEMILESLL